MDFVPFDDRSMLLSVKMRKRNGNMEGKHGKKDEKGAEYRIIMVGERLTAWHSVRTLNGRSEKHSNKK